MLSDLDLVVFDMAGTTVAVTDEVPAAFRKAFSIQGVALSDEEISSIRGKAKREAIAALLIRHGQAAGPGDVERIHTGFQGCLSDLMGKQGIHEIPGAEKTFDWLRTRYIKVALTTGFERPIMRHIVAALGWDHMVDAVVCNEDVARGRPAPDLIFEAMKRTGVAAAERVVAVGDESDLRAAEAAGVRWKIGVMSGAHSRGQLESCPHSVIIGSVANLPALIAR